MTTFNQALRSAIAQAICEAIEDPAVLFSLIRLVRGNPQLVLTSAVALFVARQLCNRAGDSVPPPVPFSGGQCDCVRYNISFQYLFDSSNIDDNICRQQWFPSGATLWGPVTAFRFREQEQTNCGDAFRALEFFCRGPAGGFDPCGSPRWVGVLSFRFNAIRNVVVTRADGQPDNCGDPPAEITPLPPSGITNNINFEFDSPTGPVNVPLTFTFFQAFLDASFNLQIPITLNFNNNVNFNATFNVGTGDIQFQFFPYNAPPPGEEPEFPPGLPPGGGGPPGNQVITPPPPPPPDPEFQDRPDPQPPTPRRVIRAVAVTADIVDPIVRGMIVQTGGNPDIYVPDLGMVQFLIQVGNSVFWTNNQRVNNQRAFIPCEWEAGALEVRGTPREGVVWTLTPVYAPATLVNG